jgi:predicted nucleic acid-binding protein
LIDSPQGEPPEHVYLDTSLVIAATVAGGPNAVAGLAFCRALAAHRSRVYYSETLRIELSQAIRKLATKPDRLDAGERTSFSLVRWERDAAVRRRWMQHGIDAFHALLDTFAEVFELPFKAGIWTQSVDLMVDHFLQSRDAVHVATARTFGVSAFATTDRDFSRVGGLDVILVRDVP